tara:strand:+ start:464 stop:916 length:453 start_codon:yes stop_codon:yes gene_type:complete
MNDFQDLYQEIVMDHNRRPRNFGKLEDATSFANGFNPLCGDEINVYLKLVGDEIADIAFDGDSCAISKSSASMLTDGVKGKKISDAIQIFESFREMITRKPGEHFSSDILGELEILSGVSQFPARIKCATLPWHTFHTALTENDQSVSTE